MEAWDRARLYLEQCGVNFTDREWGSLRADLDRFLFMLLERNELVNLTAIRDYESALWKHVVDSLLVTTVPNLGLVLDWGSGGGLPGIPLSLFRRSKGLTEKVLFIDSVGRKLVAVRDFCTALGLDAQCFHDRGERFLLGPSGSRVDTVVMRAVAPAPRAVKWLRSSVSNWVFFLGPNQVQDWSHFRREVERNFIWDLSGQFILPDNYGSRYFLRLSSKRST